ncbi:MAG TPA: hypothetical protein VF013_03060 [Candidatus Limnocylindria bacterium]
MPSQSARTLVRAYYVIAGIGVGLVGLSGIWNGISAASRGCRVVFSQADFVEPPSSGPIPSDMPLCQQYVDPLAIVVGLAAALVLLIAAIRLSRTDRWSRPFVAIGALLGIAVGAVPMYMVWWASDYYNGSPPDVIGLLIGTPGLLLGLAAAWVTWRVQTRGEASARPSAA